MRPAGQITCIVVFLVFSVLLVTARSDDTGQAVFPVETATGAMEKSPDAAETYFDPDLESILAVSERSQYEFLARLTPAEQKELARMIKKRVDDESGVVVSIMAVVSAFVPAIISAQFADKMEPATVARISDKVSVKKAIAIAKHLKPEFLAEVAVYQDPLKVTAVVEGLPDDHLIDITRILFSRNEYRVVARFSDGLSPEKLKKVAEKINDPVTLIEIARHMQNREKVVRTSVSLSDDYLLGFMRLLSSGDDYALAAAVGRELDVDRQVRMLNRLEPEKAARLASHYPPERIARIMEKTDDRKLVAIAVLLSPETMGHVSGALNSRNMDRFINLVSREQILAALPYIDLERFKKDWPELAPGTQNMLRDIGNDYPPLAEAILSIE